MPKRAARYYGDRMSGLERSRVAVMEFLAAKFPFLLKALDEDEIHELEMGVEDVLFKSVEAQSLHVFGRAAKYNRPPLLGKRGWQ